MNPVTEKEYESAIDSRSDRPIYHIMKHAHIGVAGLGGLGSNIVCALARSGIGYLTLADFDVVELSNINRQIYTLSDIGEKKAEALPRRIQEINPFCKIRSYDEIKDRYLKEHEGSSEEDFIKEYLKEHQYDPLTAVAGVNTYQIRGTVEKTQSCTYEGTRMLCLRVLLSQFGLFRLRINIYASEKILSNSVIEEGDDIYAIAFLTGTRQNLFFDQESNNREAKLQSL